jgi:hypothetical protein
MGLSDLMSLADRPRTGVAKHAGPSKAEQNKAEQKAEQKADAKALFNWRKAIWKRDKDRCRCCGKLVSRTLEALPSRGECHHIAGREDKAVRYDPRNGVLVCLSPCHERLTRRELFILGSAKRLFTVKGKQYLNADGPLSFVTEKPAVQL